VLLIYGWSYKAHLSAIRHYYGSIPVLFRGDSTLLDEKPSLKTLLRRLFLNWVYRHVDIALYVGTQNRRYFEKHGLTDEKLVFAPHAIDNKRFVDAPGADEEAMRWRKQLGISEDDKALLFVGKLEPKKGPDLLLKAFLSDRHYEQMHLVYVGSGVLEKALREQSNQRIHFLGFQNQTAMPVVYRLGDIVVLPSRGPGETWGLVLNEAMACGRPVIASTRVGAAIDLVQQDKNGWLFDIDVADGLEQCLKSVQSCSKKNLTQMGAYSERVIKSWSIDQQVDAIYGICGNLARCQKEKQT